MFTTQWLTHEMGDITLGWTADQAETMTALIQKKIDEGYTFFVKDADDREVRLKNIGDLHGRAMVIIGDRDAESLIFQGKIGIVDVSGMLEPTDDSEISAKPMRRAKTAKEAATSNTVAVPKKTGG